jgi:amino acid permease
MASSRTSSSPTRIKTTQQQPLSKLGLDRTASSSSENGIVDETKPFRPIIDHHTSENDHLSNFDQLTTEIMENHNQSNKSEIPKLATWQTAGLLMIADVVGAGVMSLATAFAQLGWVLAIISLIFWYLVNMYVGLLIKECHEAWPKSESFGDLAMYSFGRKTRIWTSVAVYTFLAFVLGDYVLILGETLQMIFYEYRQCSLVWTAVGILFLLPLSQIRLLALTNWLMLINVFTIIFSIFIALGRLATMSSQEMKDFRSGMTDMNSTQEIFTEVFASKLTILSFFHSQALFAFAYMGVFIYLEIISEMQNPKDFTKSLLWLSGPFQFAVYGITGALGYILIGSQANGLLIKQIPFGPAYRISAFLLAIHMVLTFLVKGTILSRAVHSYISPDTSRDFSTPKAHRIYLFISVMILIFCFLVANLIPFFDDLTSILGALQTPFIGFMLPIFFAIKARKVLGREPWKGRKELVFMGLIIFWMVLLFFIGVVSSVKNIVDKWTSYGAPFRDC